MFPNHYAFPAFFYYDNDGISIEFPDLPGCLPCAQTSQEAFHNAKEALGLHLFGMEQDGDTIPTPTPIRDLHAENGAVVTVIEVFMPPVRNLESLRHLCRMWYDTESCGAKKTF